MMHVVIRACVSCAPLLALVAAGVHGRGCCVYQYRAF